MPVLVKTLASQDFVEKLFNSAAIEASQKSQQQILDRNLGADQVLLVWPTCLDLAGLAASSQLFGSTPPPWR